MLKLGLLNGQILADIDDETHLLNGTALFEIAGTLTDNYTDISSVTNWHIYGNNNGKDYRVVRNEIKALVKTTGTAISTLVIPPVSPNAKDIHIADTAATGEWTEKDGEYCIWDGSVWQFEDDDIDAGIFTLSTEEQKICCEHKIGSQVKRNLIVGSVNAELLGLQYNSRMKTVREIRMGYVTTFIHSELPNDAGTFLNEARNAVLDYIIFGREGTEQGDQEGITDALDGVIGTTWEGDGLKDKAWAPINEPDMATLVTKVKDKLLNGNY